jgi:hypothetical protein
MICFFGASVTQQKNSYAKIFLEKNNLHGRIHGYGGMHLCDAGICYINNVIQDNPTTCFVDFFSTSNTTCDEQTYIYLDTIIHKFSAIQCKLIFLFLHRQDNNNRTKFYDYCKKYLNDNKIIYIDLCNDITYDDNILRDIVHTTDYGSELYADCIHNKYIMLQKQNFLLTSSITKYTEYCDIKIFTIDKEIKKCVNLHGNCRILGFEIIKDSYCGILDIQIKINNFDKLLSINTWDEWCHFERNSIVHLNECIHEIIITISSNNFDTTSCKNKEIEFANIDKKLNLKSIFYIGDNLEFISFE